MNRIFRLAMLSACVSFAWSDGVSAQPAEVPEFRSPGFVFRHLRPARKGQLKEEAPLSLTASDGSGLRLVKLDARGVVEEPLAFTELRLTFENPQDRVIEGQFRVTLPQGASVSRFAMRIGEQWQEGEVVELQAARRAYEDFLHRRQDPALLEQAAGNEFSARVFPIPARGKKELILSYSHEIAATGGVYRLPLRGLPKIEALSVSLIDRGGQASPTVWREKAFVPPRDFEVLAAKRDQRLGLRQGDGVVARVSPVIESAPEEIKSLLVLVDTSASRALGFGEQVDLVGELLSGMKAGSTGDIRLVLAAFDQTVAPIYDGKLAAFGQVELNRLRERRALGASDLHGALTWAGTQKGLARVLLVTDGVATAGLQDGDRLRSVTRALASSGVQRMDALVLGGIRDEDTLGRLVTAGLPSAGTVIDGDLPLPRIAEKLTRASRSGLAVKVEGAEWVWPETLDGVQPGDEVLLYAKLPNDKPFRVSIGGKALSFGDRRFSSASEPLVTRALAKAQIDRLIDQREKVADDPVKKTSLKEQIIALSTRHRVVSPFTALLVLETEEDYARFGIDRRALSEILTVNESGIALLPRREPVVIKKSQPPPPAPEKKKSKASESGLMKEMESSPATESADKGAPPRDEEGLAMEAPKMVAAESAAPSAEPNLRAALDQSPGPSAQAPSSPSATPRPRDTDDRRVRADRMEGERPQRVARDQEQDEAPRSKVSPYAGPFKEVMDLLDRRKVAAAVDRAWRWRSESPGDVMALTALGEASERKEDFATAARAYGSIIDLFPGRADLRRFAGERLDRLKSAEARALAADTYAKAAEQRPDHPASHRLLAISLLRAGRFEEAFAALEKGLKQQYPSGRFASAREILAEDLGLVAAAWVRADSTQRGAIEKRLNAAGAELESKPSLRFVLNWETDANDVDFHIYDGKGNHAWYSNMQLASGGRLYADVTTGYGPECFTIPKGQKARTYPYKLQAHYYSRGPMGYGMGKLQIIEHDGKGVLTFSEHPFVIMKDKAFVELARVPAPLAS